MLKIYSKNELVSDFLVIRCILINNFHYHHNLVMIVLPDCGCHSLPLPLLALSRWSSQVLHRCYWR